MKTLSSLADWYAQPGRAQVHRAFFEERLLPVVRRADSAAACAVVSFHKSKSVILPVVRIESLKLGLKIWMRNDFYDWAVTVEAERPVPWKGAPDSWGESGLQYCYFEGFEHARLPLHGPHERNPARFSFHCGGHDSLMEIIQGILAA